MFHGEGQYNLNNMKEISVTDSFMGLHRDTRNCQNIETFNDCQTRAYMEKLRKECGCLPLSLQLTEKVNRKSTLTVLAGCSNTSNFNHRAARDNQQP